MKAGSRFHVLCQRWCHCHCACPNRLSATLGKWIRVRFLGRGKTNKKRLLGTWWKWRRKERGARSPCSTNTWPYVVSMDSEKRKRDANVCCGPTSCFRKVSFGIKENTVHVVRALHVGLKAASGSGGGGGGAARAATAAFYLIIRQPVTGELYYENENPGQRPRLPQPPLISLTVQLDSHCQSGYSVVRVLCSTRAKMSQGSETRGQCPFAFQHTFHRLRFVFSKCFEQSAPFHW